MDSQMKRYVCLYNFLMICKTRVIDLGPRRSFFIWHVANDVCKSTCSIDPKLYEFVGSNFCPCDLAQMLPRPSELALGNYKVVVALV